MGFGPKKIVLITIYKKRNGVMFDTFMDSGGNFIDTPTAEDCSNR
jgi:hypothetical protein